MIEVIFSLLQFFQILRDLNSAKFGCFFFEIVMIIWIWMIDITSDKNDFGSTRNNYDDWSIL